VVKKHHSPAVEHRRRRKRGDNKRIGEQL